MKRANLDDLVDLLGRWASGRGPLYLLLTARLRGLIDDGVLPPGEILPPDRVLAGRLAVGRGTVVAAYDLLQQEGRVVRRQGSGTRVADAQLPATRAATDVVTNPLLLHILQPPDGVALLTCAAPDEPPPALIEAYQAALASLALVRHDIGYQPAGQTVLREAIAAYYRGRGLPTSPQEILVTTGAQQAITLLTELLVAPGDTVETEIPTYPGALEVFRHASAVIRPLRDLSDRPSLAYVVPTARNPTGSIMDGFSRRRLARLSSEHDVPLIDDEVCAELCFDGDTPSPLASYPGGEQVITIASLSKIVWGGLRVGWVRAPAALVSRLARLRAIQDLGGEVLAQRAAAHLLGRLDEVRRARVATLRAGHDHLCGELRRKLPDWEFEPAEGGQTIWVRLPRGDVDSFAQVALRHGVAVPPGRSFDPTGGHAEHMRLHFLFAHDVLTEAVDNLAAAWEVYDGARRPASRHSLIV
ncbi:PLP-dependent aminotransferase family protein [Nonomuraea sp. NPDC050556]|uniref:aminotransferase-like domain-containing protein n=1 Tax=Nonomuraea sp. NPDC050556 TaxID=3364369 RepID=UPI00379E5C31